MMHGAAGGRLTDGEMVAVELQDGRLVDVADDVVCAVGVVRVVVGIAGRPDRALGRVVHRAALCNDHKVGRVEFNAPLDTVQVISEARQGRPRHCCMSHSDELPSAKPLFQHRSIICLELSPCLRSELWHAHVI